MPTRKIADLPEIRVCRHPEHNPPNMMVFKPGVYEHECPRCGEKKVFSVGHGPMLKSDDTGTLKCDGTCDGDELGDCSHKSDAKLRTRAPIDMSADYSFGYDWASLRR